MNTTSFIKIPGYKYNEYLIVLNPNEALRDKIIQVKNEFAEKYKTLFALSIKPHIALVNFIQFEMIEERLVNRLKMIAMGYPAFKVALNGYGSLPNHTLFINVASGQQVQHLSKQLRPAQRLMALNKDNKPHFINDFFLTIGRKLLPWQYEKAWQEYSHRHFTGGFIADGMLLLKRPVNEKNYQIVQRFEFMNLQVNTTQGQLFI